MKSSDFEIRKEHRQGVQGALDERQKERSRSREKKGKSEVRQDYQYLRKFDEANKKLAENRQQDYENKILKFSRKQNTFTAQNTENQRYKEVVRSLLRIQQGREQPIDKISKIVWIYKNRIPYDHSLHEIMLEPKKYINKITEQQAYLAINTAKEHRDYEQSKNTKYYEYWDCIISILNRKLVTNHTNFQQIKEDYKYQVKEIIKKPLPQLLKLQKQAQIILKNQTFGSSHDYWSYVLDQVRSKKIELILQKFYDQFRNQNEETITKYLKQKQQFIHEEPTSPKTLPFTAVNSKLIVTEQQEYEYRKKLAEKIFKQEFEKGQQRLENNLSLPHNHSLLSTQIITDKGQTYDQITKQIIQFEKYKRMQDDEEQFNDWVPCQTEGRFRQLKPFYVNRVRVSCEWTKYNSAHYTEENPPPKTVQGYKFNIFYPQLYDKQKTPQYYLEQIDDPNYCIIKFKAGPPYKDIAFKILKKEWDFTLKSGFESMFSKGILQLYFNFKKPKYRI